MSSVDLFEEIAICGFPSGAGTFSLGGAQGMRVSSILQFGIVAGFMPHDSSPKPYGIQTDILTTAGSSGSAIVNMNGCVIGLVQKVISSPVFKEKEVIGYASVGICFGVLNTFFDEVLAQSREAIEKGSKAELRFELTGMTDWKIIKSLNNESENQ